MEKQMNVSGKRVIGKQMHKHVIWVQDQYTNK